MKIALPSDSKQQLGGGFSFRRNFIKGLGCLPGYEYCDRIEDSDICLVASTSMVTRQTIDKIKGLGKKLVVRNNGVPRNSRNRNTGTSRLKEFNQKADGVIYQCKWAQEYLSDFIGREGVIIYNGVDTDIFKPEGTKYSNKFTEESSPIYLYSRFNRDETKNWQVAWYEYQMIQRENPKAGLIILGNFSPEHQKFGFDFFQNERYVYLPPISSPEIMASVYRGSDFLLATYFADCFSNTYLEFLATKNPKKAEDALYKPDLSGGTREMIELWNKHGRKFFELERVAKEYEAMFEKLI